MDSSSPIPVVLALSETLAVGACLEGQDLNQQGRQVGYRSSLIDFIEWYGGLMLFSLHSKTTTPIARLYIPGLVIDIRRSFYPARPSVSDREILHAWTLLASGNTSGLLRIAGRLYYPRGYTWIPSDKGSHKLSPTCKY